MQQATPEKPMEKTAQAPAQPAQQPVSQKQADTAANQPAQQNALASMQRSDVVGKQLYDNDGNSVASIQDVKMGPDGKIQAVEVDVGGFLGIGSRRVSVPADTIHVKGDRIEFFVEHRTHPQSAARIAISKNRRSIGAGPGEGISPFPCADDTLGTVRHRTLTNTGRDVRLSANRTHPGVAAVMPNDGVE